MKVLAKSRNADGFTLIELSIVLVIIGLITGGILFGGELIRAAELRAVISQVEKFRTAENMFKNKYGQLPGDMLVSKAAQFGLFTFTGPFAGSSDYGSGDGVIHNNNFIEGQCAGESSIYFRHLGEAGLVNVNTETDLVTDTTMGAWPGTPSSETRMTPYTLSSYLPSVNGGKGYFCAGNTYGSQLFRFVPSLDQSKNLYVMTGAAKTGSTIQPTMTPVELYSLDLKIDDGMPLRGRVLNNTFEYWDYADYIYWSATADSDVCSYGGVDQYDDTQRYNAAVGRDVVCQPIFVW